jgi:hypothetical protein
MEGAKKYAENAIGNQNQAKLFKLLSFKNLI